jgi:hypothetical protein
MKESLPFEEQWINETQSIRRFSPLVQDEELKWHMDNEDRIIEPLEENDWKFQFDNELPIKINAEIVIKKDVWHRLVKGNTDLILKITRV